MEHRKRSITVCATAIHPIHSPLRRENEFPFYSISEMPQNVCSINNLAVFFARITIRRIFQGVSFAFPIYTRATLPTFWIIPWRTHFIRDAVLCHMSTFPISCKFARNCLLTAVRKYAFQEAHDKRILLQCDNKSNYRQFILLLSCNVEAVRKAVSYFFVVNVPYFAFLFAKKRELDANVLYLNLCIE